MACDDQQGPQVHRPGVPARGVTFISKRLGHGFGGRSLMTECTLDFQS